MIPQQTATSVLILFYEVKDFDFHCDVNLLIWRMSSGGLSKCTALCGPFAPAAMPACFPFEVFEMLTASPSPLVFSVSPPDSSSNYIRQLETKVRILEDDNNKLLSQVRCMRADAAHTVRASVAGLR